MLSIFWYPYKNIEFHAENAHISPSHAQRSLANISDFLEQHDAQLSKSKACYYIEGKSEQNLRFLFADIMIEYQTILDFFPSEKFMLELLEILKTSLINHNMKLDDLHLHNLNMVFFLSIMRESQGFHLHNKIDFLDEFEVEMRSYNSEGLFNEKAIHSGLEQMAILMHSYNYYLPLKEEITKEIYKFIPINDHDKLSINKISETIYQYIILRLNYVQKLNQILDRSGLYGQKFRDQNPVLMRQIFKTIDESPIKYKKIVRNNIDEIIFWVSIESPDFRMPIPKNILVLSDFGNKHAYDLKVFISDHFPIHHISSLGILRGVPDKIIQSIENNEFDLVISTVELDILQNKKSIYINDYPNEHDLKEIYRQIMY